MTGNWLGTISAGAAELRLAFHIESKNGELTGTMDSLDQGANGIALGIVKMEGATVLIPVPSVRGVVEGKLSEDGNEINGNWLQGAANVPLVLKRVKEIPKAARPQEPVKPYPYDETEVSYDSLEAGVRIAGTLTTPRNRKPAPAVLLITGSGAQDRNESLMQHKPFLVLSDYLTRRGIAVLRVDDRGIGGSTGKAAESTSLSFVKDVLAGVSFLKSRPEVDGTQIGLLGHSEGGLIAPMAAAQSKDVRFIVLLAGPGVTGDKIILEQSALISRAMNLSEGAIQAAREQQERVFEILRTEPDETKAREKIQAIAGAAGAKQAVTPWFRTFIKLDPAEYLKQVTCPVLAINGSLDLQVAPKQNLPAIEKALKEGGNKDFTVKEMPQLNHLLQTAKTGVPSEYGKIEETMSPVALDLIATWIQKHTSNTK
ncbi:MAG: alpha/beta fold hydrolase [Acidobacteria bacterium]|nr:alpha/beta fold hydrolase [Acidobacteriota bacterium]